MMAYNKPNYSNSSFYKDTKDIANQSYDAALNKDKSQFYTYAGQIGGSLGTIVGSFMGQGALGAAIGSSAGIALGGLARLIGKDKAVFVKTERDSLQTKMISNRNSLYGSAETAMNDRNKNLSELKRLGNSMKMQFDYTYGSGMFDELQGAISQILGLSDGKKIYEVLSSLNPDTVVGELANRLVYNDANVFSDTSAFTSDDYRNILEKTVSLGDLGSEFTKMFSDAFLSKIESDIESEMNIGASEAKSSGFKNRNGSASTKYQKVRKDISDVAYLTTIQMYQKSLESQISTLQTSRQRAYYEYQRQILTMQNKIESDMNESLNNYIYGVGKGLSTAEKLEFEEASSIAGAMAYNEKIGEYNSNDKKVYDIEGVTGG